MNTEAGFALRAALVGNPVRPDIPFDSAALRALRARGFNTVQLNIAWGCRPGDEPLNLEDLLSPDGRPDARQRRWFDEIARRAALAHAEGFRTIFHFGAPRMTGRLYQIIASGAETDRETQANSIQDPRIVQKYTGLLTQLARRIPQIDDVLMYTFDQEAWLGSEFGDDALAAGVPLHLRVPPFLHSMTQCWAAERPDGRLWWEPWEISGGTLYALAGSLPTDHFGLMLHANIAEVQKTNPADRWLRNMVLLAAGRGIPVCGEIFMTGADEETEPLQHAFAPALVWEEIHRLQELGLYGIKEYYGTRPDMPADLDLAMAGLCFADPSLGEREALEKLAARWPSASTLPAAMAAAHRGLALFPWELTWRWRALCVQHTAWHPYTPWRVPGEVAPSPSWRSSRRAVFMLTGDEPAHDPWLIEDMGLRCREAAAALREASGAYAAAGRAAAEPAFEAAGRDFARFAAVAEDEALHAEETLCAIDARHFAARGEVPAFVLQRMRRALCADVENQRESSAVAPGAESPAAAALSAFDAGPAAWCLSHF